MSNDTTPLKASSSSSSTKRNAPHGPKTLKGSASARKVAVAILELLGGLRTPTEASEALSLSRYYMLETRALQGMIDSLEPRPRGRRRRPEDEVKALERDKRRLEQELARAQALVRAAERSIGLSAAPTRSSKAKASKKAAATGKKAKRTRKAQVRAQKAIDALRSQGDDPAAPVPSDFPPRS